MDELEKEIEYMEREDPDNPDLYELKYRDLPNQKSWREYYRDNRDMSAFYLLGVYILAAVDAYVVAHLFDFDVSETGIAYSIMPDINYGKVNFQIQIPFSISNIFE